MTGLKVPTVVLPFVNSALAIRIPFQHSVENLRREGSASCSVLEVSSRTSRIPAAP